jgi:hypothetical protein
MVGVMVVSIGDSMRALKRSKMWTRMASTMAGDAFM